MVKLALNQAVVSRDGLNDHSDIKDRDVIGRGRKKVEIKAVWDLL